MKFPHRFRVKEALDSRAPTRYLFIQFTPVLAIGR